MKYCIGCRHLAYADKKMGYGSKWTGSWTREEASMACALDHWRVYLNEDKSMFDLEKAMEAAETCPDFKERPSPEPEQRFQNAAPGPQSEFMNAPVPPLALPGRGF